MAGTWRRSVFSILIILFAALARAAGGPEGSGSVEGRVLDQTQAVMPGVRVRLEKGSLRLQAVTDAGGSFSFPGLPPGSYSLSADHEGFQKWRRQLDVESAPVRMDVLLQAETLKASVTVSETAPYQVFEASSATKTLAPLRDIPQSIQVVSRELIGAQASVSMQDVLRNVSGVSVHLGEGRRDQVYIRGFSALRDSYVDGVRDDATYYRDLSNIERVEVIKGPASVLYGRGSSGGMVNRVTKKPNPERLLGEVTAIVGSYGMKRTSLDFGLPSPDGRLAFRLNGAYEDSGSHRHYYALNRYSVAPSVVWRLSDRSQLLAQFEQLEDDRIPDRGIPSVGGRPANVPAGSYYGFPQDDFLNNDVTAQALTLDHQISSVWTVRNVFRHSKYRNAFNNTYPLGVRQAGGETLVTRGQYNSNGFQENYFNQAETSVTTHVLGMTHTLLLGAEAGSQGTRTDRFTGTAKPVGLSDPFLTAPAYSAVPGVSNGFDGKMAGVYIQDQIRLASKWKALAGLRRDYFRQRFDDLTERNIDLKRTDHAWSPRAGVVYQPSHWTSLYASYSRSFLPSGEGLSLAANTQDLKPETAENYEAGAKNDWFGGRLTTTLAVFRLDRNNMKTIDPIDPNRLVLVGRQRTDGVELSLAGSVRNWNLYGGWAWLDTAILRSNDVSSGVPLQGNRAGHIPLNHVTLWSTYSFENGFGIGGGFTHNSNRFTSNDNLVLLPAYSRVDTTVFYRTRHYGVTLNLRNLFNARYYETAHGNFQIYPGAPVNGLLTLQYRW